MNIRATKSSKALDSTIYIFNNVKELQSLQLSNTELEYVKVSIREENTKIMEINRFPSFLYLIKTGEGEAGQAGFNEELRKLGNKALRMVNARKVGEVLIISGGSPDKAYYFAEGMALGAYQFLKYFSDKDKQQNKLSTIHIYGIEESRAKDLEAIIRGVYKARDLINEPLSYLTATQLANEAVNVGKSSGFKVDVLNKKKIEALKMGGLLAVNKGSIDPPTFSVLEYAPERAINEKPIVFVGKGVVYDTGGLSLKPTAGSMDSMKSDMSGAAAVIGAMMAIAECKLPVKIIGLIPATDNRPGENAYAPGDVVKMHDGTTVEVLNTDAEGRMLLADALSYAKKLNPELVIDLATLTGAAAVAIGKYGVVAMGTAKATVMNKLQNSGEEVYERIAVFPFWDEYKELLNSSIADVKNIGGREGGAITAGKFLQRFTDYPWIHLDIAGPAFLNSKDEYRPQGGTGVGVRLLFNYIKSMVK